jgi:sigma-B regulation protein RsbU (phosphoserine phosphatase)
VLEKELNIGQEVQQSILPKVFVEPQWINIDAHCIPARQVGGDFYDQQLIEIEGHPKIAITIADTSGKGVFACLYSLGLRTLFRATLQMCGRLQDSLILANRLFCLDTQASSAFVTAFIALYDPKTYVLDYTSCGHLPAVLMRRGQLTELKTQGMAIGVIDPIQIEVKTLSLEQDDKIVLYSDGVIDALNKEGMQFGKDRFFRLLQEHANLTPKELIQKILSEVKSFAGAVEAFDDITLVVFKRP